MIKRNPFALKVMEGKTGEFRRFLGRIYLRVVETLKFYQMTNFSLWSAGNLVFGYYETEGICQAGAEELRLIFEEGCSFFQWISDPTSEMELMYHNFGIIRQNKELIRHRVFMTRLKPGCDREYKRRHDALIAERKGIIDPGPDSNFSIWSNGTFVFGYDEIDVTMEVDETKEAHEKTVAWETNQLEIMDWITNDVDWLTGQIHPSCVCLMWHL